MARQGLLWHPGCHSAVPLSSDNRTVQVAPVLGQIPLLCLEFTSVTRMSIPLRVPVPRSLASTGSGNDLAVLGSYITTGTRPRCSNDPKGLFLFCLAYTIIRRARRAISFISLTSSDYSRQHCLLRVAHIHCAPRYPSLIYIPSCRQRRGEERTETTVLPPAR